MSYAPGDAPVGAYGSLADIDAFTSYNYEYYEGGGGSAPVLLGNTQTFDQEVLIAGNFDVAVDVFASGSAQFTSTYANYTETAEGGATADATFVIDKPGYSAYTIEGVPAGPAAAATPEPATWAMMLLGFAGLGFFSYRHNRVGASPRGLGSPRFARRQRSLIRLISAWQRRVAFESLFFYGL